MINRDLKMTKNHNFAHESVEEVWTIE